MPFSENPLKNSRVDAISVDDSREPQDIDGVPDDSRHYAAQRKTVLPNLPWLFELNSTNDHIPTLQNVPRHSEYIGT